MIGVLVVTLLIETCFIYFLWRDVLNPSFVFVFVFLVAAINLMTNINSVGVSIGIYTVLIVAIGSFSVLLGCLVSATINQLLMGKYSYNLNAFGQRNITMGNILIVLIFFADTFGVAYILCDVYSLAKKYGGYRGNLFGALGRYAEVSKFADIGLKVSTVSTFFGALLEAEAYVLGYIIVQNWVNKEKNPKLVYLCFVASFLSTFCQGSRGGIFILIALAIVFVMLSGIKNRTKKLKKNILVKVAIAGISAVVIFQASGVIANKNWNVPIYEYLSVYLGFPIYNLDIAVRNSIPRAEIPGSISFSGLYKKILGLIAIEIPKYNYFTFIYLGKHNMGNGLYYFRILDC